MVRKPNDNVKEETTPTVTEAINVVEEAINDIVEEKSIQLVVDTPKNIIGANENVALQMKITLKYTGKIEEMKKEINEEKEHIEELTKEINRVTNSIDKKRMLIEVYDLFIKDINEGE